MLVDIQIVWQSSSWCAGAVSYKLLRGKAMATRPTLSILAVAPIFCGKIDDQISFLQQNGLLATDLTCSRSDDMHFELVASLVRANSLSNGGLFCCIGGFSSILLVMPLRKLRLAEKQPSRYITGCKKSAQLNSFQIPSRCVDQAESSR